MLVVLVSVEYVDWIWIEFSLHFDCVFTAS